MSVWRWLKKDEWIVGQSSNLRLVGVILLGYSILEDDMFVLVIENDIQFKCLKGLLLLEGLNRIQ